MTFYKNKYKKIMSTRKRIIKDEDVIFATGVYLMRKKSVSGGWIVTGFQDDSFFDGDLVESEEDDDSVTYYTEKEGNTF